MAASPEKLQERAMRAAAKGRLDDALALFRQAIETYRQNGNRRQAADLGLEVGHSLYAMQNWAEACSFLEAASEDNIRDQSRPPAGVVAAYPAWVEVAPECDYWLGCSQSSLGQYPKAIRNLRRAAVAFETINREKRAADSFMMLGAALRDYGLDTNRKRLLHMALAKYDLANRYFRDAIEYELPGAEIGPGVVYLSSAPVYLALGMYDNVINGYSEAKKTLDRYGVPMQSEIAAGHHKTALSLKKKAVSAK